MPTTKNGSGTIKATSSSTIGLIYSALSSGPTGIPATIGACDGFSVLYGGDDRGSGRDTVIHE